MGNGQDVRAAFRAAQAMEWLIVDGLGGSASGTASGAATRRTHSLLTTVTEPGHMKTLLVMVISTEEDLFRRLALEIERRPAHDARLTVGPCVVCR